MDCCVYVYAQNYPYPRFYRRCFSEECPTVWQGYPRVSRETVSDCSQCPEYFGPWGFPQTAFYQGGMYGNAWFPGGNSGYHIPFVPQSGYGYGNSDN